MRSFAATLLVCQFLAKTILFQTDQFLYPDTFTLILPETELAVFSHITKTIKEQRMLRISIKLL